MDEFNYLSLFSGAGGGDLACQHLLNWNCVGYVEWDGYCVKVIEQRIKDGFLSDAPIFHCDIREFNEKYAKAYKGISCIAAGFPCQSFSVAGKRQGEDDDRNMWPATLRTIQITGPKHIFLENVMGLLSSGYFQEILRGLFEAGYDARWCLLSAEDCGAPHQRKRLWVVAYTKSVYGLCSKKKEENNIQEFRGFESRSKIESELGRKYDGMANDMDRLKALGNGQVSTVAEAAWKMLND